MQHIVKLCADNLRAHSINHGIKLQASHAHELVAASFGYKSKAALLADTSHPLSNIHQASNVILVPTDIVEQRRVTLRNLPLDLPDYKTLIEWIYEPLIKEKWIANIWPNHNQFAKFHADEYLSINKPHKAYKTPTSDGVIMENMNDSIVQLTVKRFYQIPRIDGSAHEEDIVMTITLERIAGHIGYGTPQIAVNARSRIRSQNG